MNCPIMMSLGVYVLGAATPAERRQLEAHLPGCPQCQAELGRLAPLPGLLAGIPEAMRDTTASGARQASAARRVLARAGARPSRAAAVAACLAVAGVSGGLWLSAAAGGPRAQTLTLSGADPATHVVATATLTATSWGSSIQLRVSGLPKNVDCRLVIRSRDGQTEVSGVWDAWQDGPVSIPGSAAWLPSDIASLQVATSARNLVTLSAIHPAGEAGR